MKSQPKGHDTADDWHEFLRNLDASYRRLYSLERDLHVITDKADALRNELTRTAAEVRSREAFMEKCRSKGEIVPDFKRPQGTA